MDVSSILFFSSSTYLQAQLIEVWSSSFLITLIIFIGTVIGAKAINRESKKGLIKKGYDADILFWEIDSLNEIPYWFGSSRISKVMKAGQILDI